MFTNSPCPCSFSLLFSPSLWVNVDAAATFHNFRVLGAYTIVWLPRLCPQHAPGLSSGHHWYNTVLWMAKNNLSLRFPRWWVQPACIQKYISIWGLYGEGRAMERITRMRNRKEQKRVNKHFSAFVSRNLIYANSIMNALGKMFVKKRFKKYLIGRSN